MKLSNMFQLNFDLTARELTLLANFDQRSAYFGHDVALQAAIENKIAINGNAQEVVGVVITDERCQYKFTDYMLDSENLTHPNAIKALEKVMQCVMQYELKMSVEEGTYDDLPEL